MITSSLMKHNHSLAVNIENSNDLIILSTKPRCLLITIDCFRFFYYYSLVQSEEVFFISVSHAPTHTCALACMRAWVRVTYEYSVSSRKCVISYMHAHIISH